MSDDTTPKPCPFCGAPPNWAAALSEAKAETANVEQRCQSVLKKLYRLAETYTRVAAGRDSGASAAAWRAAMEQVRQDLLNVMNNINNLVSPRRRMYEDEREELLREACRARAALATARAEGASLRRQLDDALGRAREAEAALMGGVAGGVR